jgi:flagellar biosynthesis protein FlhF
MVIGPTGVGKTTTIAKLSALSLREGKRVGIITFDTYRIGAVEQMRIYARIMGLPFAAASTVKDLRERLAEFAGSRDIVYIDTTGRNPRDQFYLEQLMGVCETRLPLEVHLLMSASADDAFMADAAGSYGKVPVDCIAFTKVDEAVRYGPLYNLMMTCRKPVAYLSVGQKVPDDILFPTVSNLVDLILKKGCYTC